MLNNSIMNTLIIILLVSLISSLIHCYSVVITECPKMCICEDEFTVICRNLGLTNLPEEIYLNVVALDLSYNNFETFPTIKLYSKIKYLNMSNNKISTLKLSDLEQLENLEKIDLTFNLFHDWKDIHASVFLPVKNLELLDFSNNPLRSIPKYSNHLFIPSLKILRLINCSMESIPINLFNRLKNLTELNLSENPLTHINDTIHLENLKLIDISKTNLRFINENVFDDASKLEILIANYNMHLKKINCNSNSLIYLDLSNSMLEKIPNGNFKNLYRLDLSGNFLKDIPINGFNNIPKLHILNLSMNSITMVHPEAFQKLNEVESIDLSFNKIRTLDERLFDNNLALIYLNISHNYIKKLDSISSGSLKILIASFCEIYELDRHSLISMPNLITLILSRNFLKKIPNRLIAPKLVSLDLSFCNINTLNNETFSELFYLRDVNLANNALSSIDPTYFPRIFNIDIYNNPWRCDCNKLKRMFQWIYTYNASALNDLTCSSPEKYEGKTWMEACKKDWETLKTGTKDVMWYYSLAIVVAMFATLFGVTILKRVRNIQELRVIREEEIRRTEEREILRRMQENQREIAEDENRNAPDPRELQRPPSYNEALLLPRLTASQPNLTSNNNNISVHSFSSRGSLIAGSNGDLTKKRRKKRRRRKSDEERRISYSRNTIYSDSSDDADDNNRAHHQPVQLPSTIRKIHYIPPLESDF